MSQPVIAVDPASLNAGADLPTIVAAWHAATLRLQRTHDALRDEVRQLAAEWDGKNSEPAGIRLAEMERRLIEATLAHYGGHRARTAQALGIGIRTLSGKLRQYGYAPRAKSFAPAEPGGHPVHYNAERRSAEKSR